MTSRLHALTLTAEKKDSELSELRSTIDLLRQSGADAGLISLARHKSSDSINSNVSESGDEGADGTTCPVYINNDFLPHLFTMFVHNIES